MFPKPDYKTLRILLEKYNFSLDAISADCMRHVIDGVQDIARKALEVKDARLP
jgi:hypothetical protein